MKAQIIRRLSLVIIAVLLAAGNNNNGSNIQQSVTINLSVAAMQVNYSFTSLNVMKDLENFSIHFYMPAVSHDAFAVAEPNGDNEFHSFHFNHNKRSFWKNIANKMLIAIFYVVDIVNYFPYKILN